MQWMDSEGQPERGHEETKEDHDLQIYPVNSKTHYASAHMGSCQNHFIMWTFKAEKPMNKSKSRLDKIIILSTL